MESKKTIRLIDSDRVYHVYPPITTLTFYHGTTSTVEAFISQRVHDIVQCNPWLLGSLNNSTDGTNLTYSTGNISTEFKRQQTFSIMEDTQLDETSDYGIIISRVERQMMDFKRNKSLFRVVLIRISSGKFAILVALNHTIGDGHTFYQLYGMLNEQSKPRPLIVERIQEFGNAVDEIMGKENKFKAGLGFILKFLFKLLFCKLYKYNTHSVDQVAIEKLKLEYKEKNPESFISTNDILTSWLLLQMKCDIALVTVNFRNRIPDATNDHAGNYIDPVVLQKSDFDSPSKIRAALQSYRRINCDIPLPSSIEAAKKKYALITSWVSLYEDVQLPGCNQIYHVPCYLPTNTLASCVIYRPRKGEIQVLTSSKKKMFSKSMSVPSINKILD